MVLAVHIPENSYHIAKYTRAQVNCLVALAKLDTESRVIFFTDSSQVTQQDIPPNLEIKKVKIFKSRLLQHYWLQFTLPKLLEKEKVTSFLSLQPVLVSLKNIPQHIWLCDVNAILNSSIKGMEKRKAIDSIQGAANIIVPGNSTAEIFSKQFSIRGRVSILPPPVTVMPVSNAILEVPDYSYFLIPVCEPDVNHLRILLKAFTLFKKRQRSQMKLVIVVQHGFLNNAEVLLLGYKLKNEVTIVSVQHWAEAQLLISSAYALLYLPQTQDANELSGLLLQAGKALICTGQPFWRDYFLEAAVYTDFQEEMISLQMMNLYKNETQKLVREQLLCSLPAIRSVQATASNLYSILSATPY